jgi:hypothetical protein
MEACTIFLGLACTLVQGKTSGLNRTAEWSTDFRSQVLEYFDLRHNGTREANIECVFWIAVQVGTVTRCTIVTLRNHAGPRSGRSSIQFTDQTAKLLQSKTTSCTGKIELVYFWAHGTVTQAADLKLN